MQHFISEKQMNRMTAVQRANTDAPAYFGWLLSNYTNVSFLRKSKKTVPLFRICHLFSVCQVDADMTYSQNDSCCEQKRILAVNSD